MRLAWSKPGNPGKVKLATCISTDETVAVKAGASVKVSKRIGVHGQRWEAFSRDASQDDNLMYGLHKSRIVALSLSGSAAQIFHNRSWRDAKKVRDEARPGGRVDCEASRPPR